MEYLAILGRQPEISLAELVAQFGNARQVSAGVATFTTEAEPSVDRLGGSLKIARKLTKISPEAYLLTLPAGKITLGVSDYSGGKNARREITESGLKLKKALKKQGRSVRLLPNSGPVISTAAAHHSGLGRKPRSVELLKFKGDWYVSLGSQNISAYAARDQKRPARDAKVGMLPPKLAQVLINLCGPLSEGSRILDPFCGTGVVLQEAHLLGFVPYGTDRDERMVKYSEKNLEWLGCKNYKVEPGDATNFQWQGPIDAVAAEIYLGPPMSQIPPEIKLKTVQEECGEILAGFLKNLAPQIPENTPVTLAVPAWRRENGRFVGIFEKNVDWVEKMGYNVLDKHGDRLLYARENQTVAREIIVLRKK